MILITSVSLSNSNCLDLKKIKFLYSLLNVNLNCLQNKFNIIYLFLKMFPQFFSKISLTNSEIVCYVKNKFSIFFILQMLKNHYTFQFKQLVDICSVDFCFSNNFATRFEVNYILLSLINKCHLRLKLYTSIDAPLISLGSLYSSSN